MNADGGVQMTAMGGHEGGHGRQWFAIRQVVRGGLSEKVTFMPDLEAEKEPSLENQREGRS